MGEGSGLG